MVLDEGPGVGQVNPARIGGTVPGQTGQQVQHRLLVDLAQAQCTIGHPGQRASGDIALGDQRRVQRVQAGHLAERRPGHLDRQLLQAAGEAAHERPVRVADQHLTRMQGEHAVVMVEEGLTLNSEIDRDRIGRTLPDHLRGPLDDVRIAPHARQVEPVELQIHLGAVEGLLAEHVTAQADQRIPVVVLPQLDAPGGGQAGRAEPDQPPRRGHVEQRTTMSAT